MKRNELRVGTVFDLIRFNVLYESGPFVKTSHAVFDMIQLHSREQYAIMCGDVAEPVYGNMIALHGWITTLAPPRSRSCKRMQNQRRGPVFRNYVLKCLREHQTIRGQAG